METVIPGIRYFIQRHNGLLRVGNVLVYGELPQMPRGFIAWTTDEIAMSTLDESRYYNAIDYVDFMVANQSKLYRAAYNCTAEESLPIIAAYVNIYRARELERRRNILRKAKVKPNWHKEGF